MALTSKISTGDDLKNGRWSSSSCI